MAENRVRIIIEADGREAVEVAQAVGRAVSGIGDEAAAAKPALDSLNATAREVAPELQAAAETAATSFKNLKGQGEAAAAGIEQAFKTLGVRSSSQIRSEIFETVAAYRRLADSGEVSAADLEKAHKAMASQVKTLRGELRGVGDSASQGASKASSSVRGMDSDMRRIISTIKSLGVALGVAFGVREIAQLSKELFEVGRSAAQTVKAFEEIHGGAEAAQREFEFLREVADRLGQNFWDLTDSYKGFSAAAKESGVAMDEARKIYEATVKASATLGLSSEDTKGALYALQQMISKGAVSMEELRQQLGDRLPGAFGMAAKAMGMTEREFAKAVEQGEILAKDLLPRLADYMGNRYSGEVAKAVAAQNKFNEAWMDLKVEMANSGFLDSAAEAINDLGNTLKDEDVKQGLRDLAKLLGDVLVISAKLASTLPAVGSAVMYLAPGYAQAKAAMEAAQQEVGLGKTVFRGKVDWGNVVGGAGTSASSVGASISKTPKSGRGGGGGAPSLDDQLAAAQSFADAYALLEADLTKTTTGEVASRVKAYKEAFKAITFARGDEITSQMDEISRAESLALEAYGDTEQKRASIHAAFSEKRKKIDEEYYDRQKATSADFATYDFWHVAEQEAKAADVKTIREKASADLDAILGRDTERQLAALEAEYNEMRTAATDKNAVDVWYYEQRQALRDKDLGDAAVLSASHWEAESLTLEQHLQKVKANLEDETTYTAYAAQKRDDLRKREIEARIGYEGNFLDYIRDNLAVEYGLYQSAETQKRELWARGYEALRDIITGISSTGAGFVADFVRSWRYGWDETVDIGEAAMDSLFDTLANAIGRMAQYAIENYIIIPFIGSFLGIEDNSGGVLSSLTGSGSGSDSSLLSAGKNLLSGNSGSWTSGLDSWGYDTLGIGSMTSDAALGGLSNSMAAEELALMQSGNSAGAAGVSGLNSTAGISGGLGSIASGALMGGGIGYGISSLVGNGSTASTIGGTLGGALGGAASSAMLGATLGMAAGPIGAIVGGLIGTIGGSMFGGNPKTETYTGSGYKLGYEQGQAYGFQADYYSVKESGMFGSETTTHESRASTLNPTVAAQISDDLGVVMDSVRDAAESLGMSADSLDGFTFPLSEVAEGQMDDFKRNISEAMTTAVMQAEGLGEAYTVVKKADEAYVDVLGRLATALPVVEETMDLLQIETKTLAGDALTDLVGQMREVTESAEVTTEALEQIALAQFASELIDAFGGAEAYGDAMNRYFTNVYSDAEQFDRTLTYYAKKSGEAIADLGAEGVNLENFWASYRAAMESGNLTVDQIVAWDSAAKYAEQFYATLEGGDAILQDQISALEDYKKALEDQAKEVEKALDSMKTFLSSIKEMRRNLRLDDDTTQLSAKQALDEKRSYFDDVAARAKSGDTDAQAELQSALDNYMDASRDYYASSDDYFADVQHADETLANLESYAQSEVGILQGQLDALNNEIALTQVEIDSLSLVNANLGTIATSLDNGFASVSSAVGSSYQASYAAAIQAANAAQASASAAVIAAWSGSYDAGGDAAPGFALVGESGPELVRFAQPGHVVNAANTSQALQRIADNAQGGTDTRGMEQRLDRQAAIDSDGYRRMERGLVVNSNAIKKLARKSERAARRAR